MSLSSVRRLLILLHIKYAMLFLCSHRPRSLMSLCPTGVDGDAFIMAHIEDELSPGHVGVDPATRHIPALPLDKRHIWYGRSSDSGAQVCYRAQFGYKIA